MKKKNTSNSESKVSLKCDLSLLNTKDQIEFEKLGSKEIEKWKLFKGIEQAAARNQDYFNKITIWSYGIDNGSQPKGSRAFDCRRLNMRGHGLDLRTGRGCDPEFQKIATQDHEFVEFVYLVAKCVLENNLTNIAFYCSKGHHRSVAAATFFQHKFSPKATVYHTCLKK